MVALKNLALALVILPDLVWSACQNDPTFKYPSSTDLNKLKNCKQIRNNELRRQNMCKIQAVNLACPQSCGVCCDNDQTYEFKLKKSSKMVNCYWLFKNDKKKAKRVANYCTKDNDAGKLHDYKGRSVRDACAETCGICKSEITAAPTPSPTPVTAVPTLTGAPSASPSSAPSVKPSAQPTRPPSPAPSPFPTLRPTFMPSDQPSQQPSKMPSDEPSQDPSDQPSQEPSKKPSDQPSQQPSKLPSDQPSQDPSDQPSLEPSKKPSDQPSFQPSMDPSEVPSTKPSDQPSQFPSFDPSDEPSHNPTTSIKPSASPSSAPVGPTPVPTPVPTPAPTPACDDSPTFEFLQEYSNSTKYNCKWITQHSSPVTDNDRKTKYCPKAAINAACCESCTGIAVVP